MTDCYLMVFRRIEFKLRNILKNMPVDLTVFRDDENKTFRFVIVYDPLKGGD